MNNKQSKTITLVLGVIFILIVFSSCATTSIYSCDKYIGIEKDACIQGWQNRGHVSRYR